MAAGDSATVESFTDRVGGVRLSVSIYTLRDGQLLIESPAASPTGGWGVPTTLVPAGEAPGAVAVQLIAATGLTSAEPPALIGI